MSNLWGLTGGIGSGKSTVAGILARDKNVTVIDTDVVAKRLLGTEQVAFEVGLALGAEVMYEGWQNGCFAVDFRALAHTIFTNPEKKVALEAIVHPLVWQEVERIWSITDPSKLIIVESAIIYETGDAHRFQGVISTRCTKATGVSRAIARGLDPGDAERRAGTQFEPEKVASLSRYVINTECPIQDVKSRTEWVLESIRRGDEGILATNQVL